LEFDALTAIHRETRTTDAQTSIVARRETEELAVESRGGMKVCRVQADVGDAGNGWAGLPRGRERGVKKVEQGNEITKRKVNLKPQGKWGKGHGFR
jgi:hypothetical protein